MRIFSIGTILWVMAGTVSSASACLINVEIDKLARSVTPRPENLKVTLTDRLDDWSKVMGAYLYFEGDGIAYGGYARLDQQTCRSLFADIRELQAGN
jgi:hypothetical protein